MTLEKLSNKVNPKKNIYRSTYIDKIGSIGVGREDRVEEEKEAKGRVGRRT